MNLFCPTNSVGSCLLIQYADLCPLIGALSLFKAISDKARITSTILKESLDRATVCVSCCSPLKILQLGMKSQSPALILALQNTAPACVSGTLSAAPQASPLWLPHSNAIPTLGSSVPAPSA